MKKNSNKQGGFTLIEVVLVLAIGALIILMALLAFGGASRSRRDTARKAAVGNLSSALEQYASNNNGNYPTAATTPSYTTFIAGYPNIKDPGTNDAPEIGDAVITAGIQYSPGKKCNGTALAAGSAGNYAILYVQESGNTRVCQDNTQ